MMKLILSLTLTWTLSSTAEVLQCWQGQGFDPKRSSLFPCDSTELCATIAARGTVGGDYQEPTLRSCVPSFLFSEGKHTFSLSFGFVTMAASVYVCNTDGCNNEDIPFPDVQRENGLQCFTCDVPFSAVCNQTVQCVGDEDRCISGTAQDKYNVDLTSHISGCVSANYCEVLSRYELLPDRRVKFPRPLKCCGSNFCNSAWSVKLNVITLLFGLITLTFY
ncbi:phospholipase A2 inhibitor and Ly6/PLAUR domain-containing protein-like [Scomber japonicus]|uniref:phospholipase A2 inhibitor and Ly6/PLAUR domain-containing protein-like n=1 Tax=Scomber japonicus TaxID=13676 RepID=UPI0023069BE7|nr:phospholipase A2 inhibitor and Ly6/PLAUR domain-containing protein-like [Scomber japonicus]